VPLRDVAVGKMNRCALCPGVNSCLPPDGPEDADLLFIGEAPGKDENRKGRVFIGKTGDEVNRHYLPVAGLRRENVRFTNAIRCLPISAGGKLDPNRAADVALLESCAAAHLYPEIERGRFRCVVPLGAFASRAVFGEPFDLEHWHGFPQPTAWGTPAFPMYHPALGIHEPKKMLYIRNDWGRLRRYLAGKLAIPTDPFQGTVDYAEVLDEDEMDALDPTLPLAADTESKRGGEPFCLTYTQHHGQGRLIRAGALHLLEAFNRRVAHWRAPILFHNFLYDWTVVEAMQLHLPIPRIVDTMALVFHLGNLPQGLKALALRELGMAMQDFDDLVTPYSRANVLHYYEIARVTNWPKPEERLEIGANGLWKVKKPHSMNTKLKRFFTDYHKNPDKDVFKMFEENWVEEQAMIESEIGPYPGKCISHVPFDKVLHYACRDADATLRLYHVLRKMKANVRHFSQDRWRAA
jgi:uracil-DNA glycosylase family 4